MGVDGCRCLLRRRLVSLNAIQGLSCLPPVTLSRLCLSSHLSTQHIMTHPIPNLSLESSTHGEKSRMKQPPLASTSPKKPVMDIDTALPALQYPAFAVSFSQTAEQVGHMALASSLPGLVSLGHSCPAGFWHTAPWLQLVAMHLFQHHSWPALQSSENQPG